MCSIGRHLVEFLLSEYGSYIDAILFYNVCDCLRNTPEIIKQAFQSQERSVPFFKLHIPMKSLTKPYVQDYLNTQIEGLVNNLEMFSGNTFNFNQFQKSVSLYAKMRQLSKKLELLLIQKHLSYNKYINVMYNANFLDLEDKIKLLERSIDKIQRKPDEQKKNDGINVLISGIMPPPVKIIDIMEEVGLNIVGNDIGSLSRSNRFTNEIKNYNSNY